MSESPFLSTALQIAGVLCRDAVWDGDRCNWLGWAGQPSGNTVRYVWRAQGPGLYEGTAGIGLFLAQAHRYAPDRILKTTAVGALKCALSRREKLPAELRPSLFHGWSGIAHACLLTAEALARPELTGSGLDLLAALGGIEPATEWLDVMNGSAGAIQALVYAARLFGNEPLLDTAVRHGNHLLRAARLGANGASWRTEGDLFLLGYAHGSAGIGCALLELAAATGDEACRRMAAEAFRFERSHFNPAEKAWPDLRLRTANSDAFSEGWCHGAPGIGLSRLRAYELGANDAQLAEECDAAVQRTVRSLHSAAVAPESMSFSLCHGAAGNAGFLLEAARAFGRPNLRAIAAETGRAGILRHEANGVPWQCGTGPARETPGLMLGLAGIGYFYLQLHAFEAAPPLLLVCDRSSARSTAAS